MSLKVQATECIGKNQKILSAGNSTQTGKSRAKLEPKKTETVEILEMIKSNPTTLPLKNTGQGGRERKVSQLDSGRIGQRTHVC